MKIEAMKTKRILKYVMLIVVILTISTACNGQKKNNKEKTMKQELPEYALCLLHENNYLTAVGIISDYDKQYVTFIGNGDYFLSYDTEQKATDKEHDIRSHRRNTLHVIPEGNRFRLEVRMESLTFFQDGENMGHAEPSGQWMFVGYSDDKDCEAAKVMKYFNEHRDK